MSIYVTMFTSRCYLCNNNQESLVDFAINKYRNGRVNSLKRKSLNFEEKKLGDYPKDGHGDTNRKFNRNSNYELRFDRICKLLTTSYLTIYKIT